MNEDRILEYLMGMESRIDSRFERLEVKVDRLEADVAVIKEDSAIMKKKMDSMDKKITILQKDVSVLQKDVSILQKDVSILQKDVSVLQEDVSVLQKDMSVVKKDVAYAKMRAENVSESVAVIEVEHGQMLGALWDAYSLISDNIKRIMPIVEEYEGIASDVSLIKNVVTSHSRAFSAIKAAI